MQTFGSNSRMLVAAAQLLDAQLSIDRVELTLNSRGNNFVCLIICKLLMAYVRHILLVGDNFVNQPGLWINFVITFSC